jgi:hypothetical protein
LVLLKVNLKILIANCLEKNSTIYHCGACIYVIAMAGILHPAK